MTTGDDALKPASMPTSMPVPMRDRRRFIRAATLAGAALGSTRMHSSIAQTAFPSRQMVVISPFPPGALNDLSARAVARSLQDVLHGSAIVENRPGAGTQIALEFLARQPADGHTLLICGDSNMAVMPHLQRNLPFSIESDFMPISLLVTAPAVLFVRPSLKMRSVADLIALAKSRPGELSFASAGNTTFSHTTGELFRIRAGVDVVHVPFKGTAEALLGVMGDHVDFMFVDIASGFSQIKAGRSVPLAISTAARIPQLPDVPTVSESGLPRFEVRTWQGAITRSGTPADIVAKLNHAIVAGMAMPQNGGVYEAQGATLQTSTPERFAALIAEDRARFGELIRVAGINLN